VVTEFDSIADIYDSTREPATDAEINALSDALKGCKTVLDVAVGTGRFAKPLSELGFDIIGVDISRNMMLKARKKGVDNLVLADMHEMPFRDKSFDAAIVIHVLHIIADWPKAMRDVGRVTKKNVISLLRQRPGLANQWGPDGTGIGALYLSLREKAGYPVRRTDRRRMWQNEQEIKTRVPPLKLETIRDEMVSMTLEEVFNWFERRSPFMIHDVPAEVHKRIVEKIIAMKGKERFERRIIEELAVWEPARLEALRNLTYPRANSNHVPN
jgi:SAM-dependent methyltransferase